MMYGKLNLSESLCSSVTLGCVCDLNFHEVTRNIRLALWGVW